MNIRKANESDVDLLVGLIRKSFSQVAVNLGLNEKDHPRCTSFYTSQRMIEDFARGVCYYILEQDSNAVGCVAMEIIDEQVCYLMRLAVLPDYRKKNLGEQLVRHVLKKAKKAGAKDVRIGIVADADRLKKWYEKLGFVQFKSQMYDHLPFLVASMSRQL